MENEFAKKLEEKIKPLYYRLIERIKQYEKEGTLRYPKAFFCMQWGKLYPEMDNTGILFIGRATNGWVTDKEDIDILFGNSEERIFNRTDQMQWVEDCEGNKSGYNTQKSAFWRVIKNVSKRYYSENWSAYVAWSNICKVAPYEKGNPNNSLYYAQIDLCCSILGIEIELLSPKIIILFTGENWAEDFLCYLTDKESPQVIKCKHWGKENQYTMKVYLIDGRIYILTEHPQGKKEDLHIQAIIEAINEMNIDYPINRKH